MILLNAVLSFLIINPDGSVERQNQQYEAHYNSDENGGYYFHDNEGNNGRLTNYKGRYTYRQQNNSGPIVIKPQKNKR